LVAQHSTIYCHALLWFCVVLLFDQSAVLILLKILRILCPVRHKVKGLERMFPKALRSIYGQVGNAVHVIDFEVELQYNDFSDTTFGEVYFTSRLSEHRC